MSICWLITSGQGAYGGVDTVEVSVLGEADASFANHPGPPALAETESWTTDQKRSDSASASVIDLSKGVR